MSKSITGSGSLNLTLNELRLLEIKATAIEATNATITNQLNGNNAIFNGTVSIGNLTIDNATINQLLSANNITALGTISATNFDIVAENKSGDTNFPISFHDTSTDRVSIGDASYLSSFTFNPSTRTMVLENGQITNATIALGDIAIANINDANIIATGVNDSVDYNIIFLRTSDNRICKDSNDTIKFNPFTNILTVNKISIAQQLILIPTSAGASVDFHMTFLNTANEFRISGTVKPFTFNPSSGVIKSYDLELSNDLTVTGRTDLGDVVSINSLDTTATNTSYRVLVWDNAGGKTVRSDANVHYDTTTNTLFAPNFSGNISLVAQTRSDNTSYPVSFHDTTTNEICIDSVSGNITWNPFDNILQVTNVTVTGDTTITAVNSTVSNNNRIPFIEGGGATGRLCESNLYYNPNSQTLVSANITTTTAINSPTVTVMGTNNGQLTIDSTYGLFLNHSDGFVFRMAGIWKYRISSSEIGMYANLRLNPDNSNNETDIIFDEYSASASGDKSIIQFSNIGKIKSSRDASLNPVLDFINTGAASEVQYQIQLNSTNNKYNTPDNGSHNFFIDTFSEFEITTSETIVKNSLTLQDVTLPNSDVDFYLLLQNSGTGQVKRSNLVFNPVSEILTINKLKLENTDTATSTDNKLLFLDPTDEVEKSDSNLSYNAATSTLNFKILDNSSADSKIIVQKPLHYGAGLFSQPLNYTIRVGHTDLINTIDVLGSGSNTGKFGNGIYLSILRSGVKTTTYGQNSLLWNWNAYVDATDTATNFTMGGLSGLWDINVSFKFQWDSGNTNRANPIIKAEINGTTTQEEGVDSQYVRQQLGRIVTVKYHNKLYFNTNDTIAFRTFINIGSTTNFSDLATSSQFDLTDFMFMATYMGPLDEYDKTPT